MIGKILRLNYYSISKTRRKYYGVGEGSPVQCDHSGLKQYGSPKFNELGEQA